MLDKKDIFTLEEILILEENGFSCENTKEDPQFVKQVSKEFCISRLMFDKLVHQTIYSVSSCKNKEMSYRFYITIYSECLVPFHVDEMIKDNVDVFIDFFVRNYDDNNKNSHFNKITIMSNLKEVFERNELLNPGTYELYCLFRTESKGYLNIDENNKLSIAEFRYLSLNK